jgi:predicted  nucleic acid-binding Zn-ribbon protein
MHPQLEILLQIQDLKAQHRELSAAEGEREVEEQEFQVNIEGALKQLEDKILELENELDDPVRARYHRISVGRGRAVVPVINGLCYGCFVAIPTALASEIIENDELRHCDHCGRFLYMID